jgi:hypothetical protein
MDQRLSFVADGRLARRVDDLAREYDLPTEEVLRQLVTVGLEEAEGQTRSGVRRKIRDGTRVHDD